MGAPPGGLAGGHIWLSDRQDRLVHPPEVGHPKMGVARFSSAILPPWCRKSPKINEVLPLLYLHGLSGVDYVYVWADGIHVNIRLGEDKLCLLVIIGVRADGRKELVALCEGYREPAGSWADLLRDCARRGMRAPVLAAGVGALGFRAALREVFPDTREQRCWFHYADLRIMPTAGRGPLVAGWTGWRVRHNAAG